MSSPSEVQRHRHLRHVLHRMGNKSPETMWLLWWLWLITGHCYSANVTLTKASQTQDQWDRKYLTLVGNLEEKRTVLTSNYMEGIWNWEQCTLATTEFRSTLSPSWFPFLLMVEKGSIPLSSSLLIQSFLYSFLCFWIFKLPHLIGSPYFCFHVGFIEILWVHCFFSGRMNRYDCASFQHDAEASCRVYVCFCICVLFFHNFCKY